MAVCVIDNPATMHREAWKDGVILSSVSAIMLMSVDFSGHKSFDFRLNCGDWKSGFIHVGDVSAMKKAAQ